MNVDFDLLAFEASADIRKQTLVFVARAGPFAVRDVMWSEDYIRNSSIRKATNHFDGLFVITRAIIDAWQNVGVDINHYFFLSP